MEDRFRADGLRASSKTVQEALRAHGFGKLPLRSSRKLEQAIRPEDALAANRRELDLPLGRIRTPVRRPLPTPAPPLRSRLAAGRLLPGRYPGPPRRVRLPLRTRPQALGPLPSLPRHGPRARRGPAYAAPSCIRASGNRRSRNLPVRRIQRCRSTGLDHRDCSQTRQTRTVGGRIISVGTRGFLPDCFVAEMTGDQLDSGNSCRVAMASGRGREGQGALRGRAGGGPRDSNSPGRGRCNRAGRFPDRSHRRGIC